MPVYTAHLVVGRPVAGLADWGTEYVLEHLGIEVPEDRDPDEIVPGLVCLYQGEAFVGVKVRSLLGQSFGPVEVGKLDLVVPLEKEALARQFCDALPDALKENPRLLPFGVYVLGETA